MLANVVRRVHDSCPFKHICLGEYFFTEGDLYIKISGTIAIRLNSSDFESFEEKEVVDVPKDVTIEWS